MAKVFYYKYGGRIFEIIDSKFYVGYIIRYEGIKIYSPLLCKENYNIEKVFSLSGDKISKQAEDIDKYNKLVKEVYSLVTITSKFSDFPPLNYEVDWGIWNEIKIFAIEWLPILRRYKSEILLKTKLDNKKPSFLDVLVFIKFKDEPSGFEIYGRDCMYSKSLLEDNTFGMYHLVINKRKTSGVRYKFLEWCFWRKFFRRREKIVKFSSAEEIFNHFINYQF